MGDGRWEMGDGRGEHRLRGLDAWLFPLLLLLLRRRCYCYRCVKETCFFSFPPSRLGLELDCTALCCAATCPVAVAVGHALCCTVYFFLSLSQWLLDKDEVGCIYTQLKPCSYLDGFFFLFFFHSDSILSLFGIICYSAVCALRARSEEGPGVERSLWNKLFDWTGG